MVRVVRVVMSLRGFRRSAVPGSVSAYGEQLSWALATGSSNVGQSAPVNVSRILGIVVCDKAWCLVTGDKGATQQVRR
jgi:hypothetical protein